MKAELIKKEGNKVTLKITVDNNKFEAAVNKAYNKSRNKYNIPGFRKGKAPRIVIETQYGKGIFYNDAIEILFPEVYPEAIKELDIDPIDNPDLDIEEISKDNGLVMVLNVEVKPEFELGNYKGIEIAKVENTVSDENVDAKLQEMVEKNARLVLQVRRHSKRKMSRFLWLQIQGHGMWHELHSPGYWKNRLSVFWACEAPASWSGDILRQPLHMSLSAPSWKPWGLLWGMSLGPFPLPSCFLACQPHSWGAL